MIARFLMRFAFIFLFTGVAAHAENRYIVRVAGGLPVLQSDCALLSCTVATNLDGNSGQLFLVTEMSTDPGAFLSKLLLQPGIANAELDTLASATGSAYQTPSALTDCKPVSFYGSTVIRGYLAQPATSLISVEIARNNLQVTGTGIVAIIDTGADLSHPVLRNVLLPGYDFTRNSFGADETVDVPLVSVPTLDGAQPLWTNPRSNAVVDQSTAAVIDGNGKYSDYGHGTMVAGIVHLTAPTAQLLPLKAFRADGTGYNSDIIRAIYYAIGQNASVINMSFNLASYSQEVANALSAASTAGIVNVAAAGNSGDTTPQYPASYPNVISVASTSNVDQLSSFSSHGNTVWLAAPGEGVVTTYPYGSYAAAWGTSFSAPFVSGTVALMRGLQVSSNQQQSAWATSHADSVNADVGNGRLNALKSVSAWMNPLGSSLF